MEKGFIFYLKSIIVDTNQFYFLAWKRLANQIDVGIDEKYNENLAGIARIALLKLTVKYGNKTNSHFFEQKLMLAKNRNQYCLSLLECAKNDAILLSSSYFLRQAKKNQISYSAASASRNLPAVVNELEKNGYFLTIVYSTFLKKVKPMRKFFCLRHNASH